ncbi:MAG: hypothetical protein KF691_02010 [Phycisphaeraceae bacterium]|nr:hypothetical protein [Phycisphaeraceae bacterium]
MENRFRIGGLTCGAFLVISGAAQAHVDLTHAVITTVNIASSSLTTTGGSNSLFQEGASGSLPSWQGFSDASQAIGSSGVLSTANFFLFVNSTNVISNGFANARVTPGVDLVTAFAGAEARVEIDFHVHGAHHFEIHSVDVNDLDGEGSAVMMMGDDEMFRFERTHVHEVRGDLPEGDYLLVLTARTQSGAGGFDSVGIFDFEFEVFEGSLCLADLNDDRLVDDADFVEFAAAYNELECPSLRHEEGCPADFNGDEMVDDADFVFFAAAYNELICP